MVWEGMQLHDNGGGAAAVHQPRIPPGGGGAKCITACSPGLAPLILSPIVP